MCLNGGISGTMCTRQVIYGEYRLLIVQSEDTEELKILHLHLPVSYLYQNWPVIHVAASKDEMYLAVAGPYGLILYDVRLEKWRVFGDITRNKRFSVQACHGWETLLLSATTLIFLTSEQYIDVLFVVFHEQFKL